MGVPGSWPIVGSISGRQIVSDAGKPPHGLKPDKIVDNPDDAEIGSSTDQQLNAAILIVNEKVTCCTGD
jgi:hypothetical protein